MTTCVRTTLATLVDQDPHNVGYRRQVINGIAAPLLG